MPRDRETSPELHTRTVASAFSSNSPDPKRTLRRQGSTASFYPNNSASNGIKPTNPFSRSAAKRGSVMALGSIEHLQHYFTKTGLAAKNE